MLLENNHRLFVCIKTSKRHFGKVFEETSLSLFFGQPCQAINTHDKNIQLWPELLLTEKKSSVHNNYISWIFIVDNHSQDPEEDDEGDAE